MSGVVIDCTTIGIVAADDEVADADLARFVARLAKSGRVGHERCGIDFGGHDESPSLWKVVYGIVVTLGIVVLLRSQRQGDNAAVRITARATLITVVPALQAQDIATSVPLNAMRRTGEPICPLRALNYRVLEHPTSCVMLNCPGQVITRLGQFRDELASPSRRIHKRSALINGRGPRRVVTDPSDSAQSLFKPSRQTSCDPDNNALVGYSIRSSPPGDGFAIRSRCPT